VFKFVVYNILKSGSFAITLYLMLRKKNTRGNKTIRIAIKDQMCFATFTLVFQKI
jgi:hypothetical protein